MPRSWPAKSLPAIILRRMPILERVSSPDLADHHLQQHPLAGRLRLFAAAATAAVAAHLTYLPTKHDTYPAAADPMLLLLLPPRYKPEVTAAVSKMSLVTPDGLPVDCALALDDKTKVALLPVEQVRERWVQGMEGAAATGWGGGAMQMHGMAVDAGVHQAGGLGRVWGLGVASSTWAGDRRPLLQTPSARMNPRTAPQEPSWAEAASCACALTLLSCIHAGCCCG